MNFWGALGIEPTTDKAAIRHAYAEKTRTCHPEEDPEGFDRLHTAFTAAMQYARRNAGTETVMEKQTLGLEKNALEQAENSFLYEDEAAEEKTQLVNSRRGAKERYAKGKESRENRQKMEQRALEEYLLQAQRQSRQQIELGQGEQEEGQTFDFGVVEQVEAQSQEQKAEQPQQKTQQKLTHEEIAWINTPGLQEMEQSEPQPKLQRNIPAKVQGKTKPERGLPRKSSGEEFLPQWALRIIPIICLLTGNYVVAMLAAIAVSWYDMHTIDFKRATKQMRSRIRALWCIGIAVLPIASLWIIAIVGGIRGGRDSLDAMVMATMLSIMIAPAGLVGMYTSGKFNQKKRKK